MSEMLPLLGLCFRAGKLICGDDAVADAVTEGEARLLLLAGDAGAGIRRRAAFHDSEHGVPQITLTDTAEELGWALGRKKTAVCCITDIGFAAAAAQKAAAQSEAYAALAQQLLEKKERIQSRKGAKKPQKKNAGKKFGRSKSTHTKRGGERA